MRIYWHPTLWRNRFQKPPFSSIHTNTAKRRFQKFPPWRAFLKRCVFGEHFHRIGGWTAGQTGRKVSLFKQKRIRVDERPKWKKKSTFSNKNGYIWMKDQTEGKNHPLKTKTDTCGRKINPEGKISFWNKKGTEWTQDQTGGENLPFQTKTDTCGQGRSCIYPRIYSSRPNLLNGSDIVNLKHEVFMITSRFPSLYHNRDFPFILFVCLFVFFFFSWNFGDSLSSILF